MKTAKILGTMSGTVLALSLVSLGGGNSVQAKTSDASTGGQITVLSSDVSAQALSQWQALLNGFTKESGVTFNLIPNTYTNLYQKLQQMIVAHETPELTWWGTEFAPWAARGAMQPLEPFVKASHMNLNMFSQPALKSMMWNGQLWQLPYDVTTAVLYYNADLFTKAHVAVPPQSWNDKTWTWAKFVHTAQLLTLDNKGRNALNPQFDPNHIVQYGVGGMQAWWFYPWYFGGDWTNQQATKYTGGSPQTIKGVQAVADLINKYHVMPSAAQTQALSNGGDMFATGRVAMNVNGVWQIPGYVGLNQFKWNIAATPIGTQHSVVLFTDGLGIGKGSKYPQAAGQFLQWLFNPKDTSNYMQFLKIDRGFGEVPALLSAQQENMKDLKKELPFLNTNVMLDALKVREAQPVYMRYNPNWNQLNDMINQEITLIMNGQKTAAQVLPGLKTQADKILSSGAAIKH